MGLIDKFKNLFTDEEIIEEEINEPIEIKEVKKEEINKLPTFMRERLDKEEKKQEENSDMEIDIDFKKELNLDLDLNLKEEKTKIEEKPSFKFPLEFNENDFIETRSRHKTHNIEEKKEIKEPIEIVKEKPKLQKQETKVSELYKEKKQEDKKFKATPIISPIYGILDKNYSSSDVETYKGENLAEKRHSKNVDFDSVRKKAYGSLTQEIKENLMCENCEYLKEAKECKKLKEKEQEVENNMVYEVLNETEDEYDYYSNITLDEATENYYDYGVEYEKNIKTPEEENIKINNTELEEVKTTKEIPPVKSSINLLSTLKKSMGDEENKNLELTDDLFNLIDSMYDERND